jgi:heme exporter protein C
MDFSPERRAVVSSVIGIVAFLDVPLVFFSAKLWPQTIHPSVVGNVQSGGMDPTMKLIMIFCVICFFFFWAAMLALRFRLGRIEAELDAQQAKLDLEG